MKIKLRNLTSLLAIAAAAFMFTGCSSVPKADNAKTKAVFNQPQAQVQKAAADALVVTGFDLKKQEAAYVEGYRPRKVGVFVGSGGETVGIWLTALAPDKTEVKLVTAKTMVGRAGQKSWDAEVLAAMTKTLGVPVK
jgi:hypothetical protein